MVSSKSECKECNIKHIIVYVIYDLTNNMAMIKHLLTTIARAPFNVSNLSTERIAERHLPPLIMDLVGDLKDKWGR